MTEVEGGDSRRRALLAVVASPPAPSSSGARATMRGNRRRDTRPEVRVRRAFHAGGLRYRVDLPIRVVEGRPIRPDVVFTRARVAIFVDGCFWHGCPEHGRLPRRNAGYWSAKVELNRDRDERQARALADVGWRVLRVWEHEDPAGVVDRVRAALADSRLVTGQAASA